MVHSQGFRFTGFSTPCEHIFFFSQLCLESNPHWGFAVISRTVSPSTFTAATSSLLPWRLEFDVSFELTAFQSAKLSQCIYFQWQPNRPNLANTFSASQCWLTETILSCRQRFQVSLFPTWTSNFSLQGFSRGSFPPTVHTSVDGWFCVYVALW